MEYTTPITALQWATPSRHCRPTRVTALRETRIALFSALARARSLLLLLVLTAAAQAGRAAIGTGAACRTDTTSTSRAGASAPCLMSPPLMDSHLLQRL